MRLLRIVLMSSGAYYLATKAYYLYGYFTADRTIAKVRSMAENTAETTQATLNKSVQVVDTGFDSAQSTFSTVVAQLDDNGLFIMFIALVALFVLRRAFKGEELPE